ncbi:hypothetical protein FJT64_027182 [Amphibalanus amphitrite]|uniref:Uncharacterized protein n=1 Tax=Amphibalanus amphitrite TaxID=1232801 RepID=A0A6A4W1H5_AMPAM|nr:hypothetical protein FJT64_027182 [Amphibalanus amphitrite]
MAARRTLMAAAILAAAVAAAYEYDYTKQELNVGVVLPYSSWRRREYLNHIRTAVGAVRKARGALTFLEHFQLTALGVHMDMLKLSASPTSDSSFVRGYWRSLVMPLGEINRRLTFPQQYALSTASVTLGMMKDESSPMSEWRRPGGRLNDTGQ